MFVLNKLSESESESDVTHIHWYDCDQVGSYCIRIMHRFHP